MPEHDKDKLVIVRIFEVPREAVWRSWAEPERAKRWWGPKDFTCPVAEIDFRVGGRYLLAMRSPEGQDFWSTGTYREIVPLAKIVATDSFADKDGNIVPSTHYGMEGFPLELEVTVAFEVLDGRTKMTLTHAGLADIDEKMRTEMEQGWSESFDKMARNLKQESREDLPA